MATQVGDIYINLKLDIKNLQAGVKRTEKELKTLTKHTKQTTKSFTEFTNNIVRTVRRLETLYVAYMSISSVSRVLVKEGIKLNQMYEDQALGIAALTTAKVKMYDSTGQELTSYETFLTSQQMTLDVMDDIKEAALDTPASFQEMLGFYQQTIGHAISANGTFGKSLTDVNKNVITFTKRMSALGSAVGMEMPKINEEIRSLMSGNASTDSQLAVMLFGSPSNANKAVKDAKTRTEGLSKVLLDALAPFKDVEGVMTYTKAVNQLSSAFDDIRRDGTKGLFSDLKDAALETTGFLKDHMEDIVGTLLGWYDKLRAKLLSNRDEFAETIPLVKDIGRELWAIYRLVEDLGFAGLDVIGYFDEWGDSLSNVEKWMITIDKVTSYFMLGLKSVKILLLQIEKIMLEVKKLWVSISTASTHMYRQSEQLLKLSQDLQKGLITAEQYRKKRAEIVKIKQGSTAIDEEQNKVIREMITLNDRLSRESIDHRLKKRKQWEAELGLIREIRGADTKQALSTAVSTAIANADGDIRMLKKIGDVAGKAYRSIEVSTRNVRTEMQGIAEDNQNNAKKVAHAARLADKQAKDLMMIEEELGKQELLRYKIAVESGKEGYSLKSKSLLIFEKEAEIAKKVFDANKKLLKGEKSQVQLAKERTNVLQTQYDLLVKMTAEINKWEGVFDNLFSGDIAGALNKALGETFEGITKGISSAIGGIGGTIAGGFMGSLLNMGVSLIAGMFGADRIAERPDTGAVEIKSNSLEDILGKIYDVQYPMLDATLQMKDALVGSVNAIEDFVSQISLGGLDVGAGQGDELSWTKKKSSLQFDATYLDLGEGTMQDYIDGLVGGYLATVMEYNKSGVFYDTKDYGTYKQVLDDEVMKNIGASISGGVNAILIAAGSLGIEGVEQTLDDVILSFGKIDTTGLSEGEAAARISEQIAYTLDVAASQALSIVEPFRGLSETLYETTLRIATETEQASVYFENVGKNISGWYESATIIDASGGMSAFSKNMNDFIGLFSETEQSAMKIKSLEKQFATLGVTLPKTNDAFIDMVNSTTDPKLYADLLSLSGAFADLGRGAEDASGSLNDLVDAWLGDLSYLTMTQKTQFASDMFEMQRNVQSGEDLARMAFQTSVTKEDYIPSFEKYINELEKDVEPKTLNDVVDKLDELINVTESASYQDTLGSQYYEGARA